MASSLLDIQPAMTVARPVDGATIHSTTYIKKKWSECHLQQRNC